MKEFCRLPLVWRKHFGRLWANNYAAADTNRRIRQPTRILTKRARLFCERDTRALPVRKKGLTPMMRTKKHSLIVANGSDTSLVVSLGGHADFLRCLPSMCWEQTYR